MTEPVRDSRRVPTPIYGIGNTYMLSSTTVSDESPIINNNRGCIVRLISDNEFTYTVNGTPTSSDVFLGKRVVEFIHVPKGGTVSVITHDIGTESLVYVTEMI